MLLGPQHHPAYVPAGKPTQLRNEATLRSFMSELFPCQVADMVAVPALKRINAQITAHKAELRRLADEHEFALGDVYAANTDAAPHRASRAKYYGRCGKTLDLVRYYRTHPTRSWPRSARSRRRAWRRWPRLPAPARAQGVHGARPGRPAVAAVFT